MNYIIAIDQSTSSTKALLFDEQCRMVDRTSVDHRQYYPRTGWVEHDAEEIYSNMIEAIRQLLAKNPRLTADGQFSLAITNQRETAVVWNRLTGRPIANAVVWQDTRGAGLCRELRSLGYAKRVFDKSGLLIDPNFSASGVKWLLDHVEGARDDLVRHAERIRAGAVEAHAVRAHGLVAAGAHVVDQAQHLGVVGRAEVGAQLLVFDVASIRAHDELDLVAKRLQHLELESPKHYCHQYQWYTPLLQSDRAWGTFPESCSLMKRKPKAW